jgi:hypothetical protein
VRTLTHPRVRRTIEELAVPLVSYADYPAAGAGAAGPGKRLPG